MDLEHAREPEVPADIPMFCSNGTPNPDYYIQAYMIRRLERLKPWSLDSFHRYLLKMGCRDRDRGTAKSNAMRFLQRMLECKQRPPLMLQRAQNLLQDMRDESNRLKMGHRQAHARARAREAAVMQAEEAVAMAVRGRPHLNVTGNQIYGSFNATSADVIYDERTQNIAGGPPPLPAQTPAFAGPQAPPSEGTPRNCASGPPVPSSQPREEIRKGAEPDTYPLKIVEGATRVPYEQVNAPVLHLEPNEVQADQGAKRRGEDGAADELTRRADLEGSKNTVTPTASKAMGPDATSENETIGVPGMIARKSQLRLAGSNSEAPGRAVASSSSEATRETPSTAELEAKSPSAFDHTFKNPLFRRRAVRRPRLALQTAMQANSNTSDRDEGSSSEASTPSGGCDKGPKRTMAERDLAFLLYDLGCTIKKGKNGCLKILAGGLKRQRLLDEQILDTLGVAETTAAIDAAAQALKSSSTKESGDIGARSSSKDTKPGIGRYKAPTSEVGPLLLPANPSRVRTLAAHESAQTESDSGPGIADSPRLIAAQGKESASAHVAAESENDSLLLLKAYNDEESEDDEEKDAREVSEHEATKSGDMKGFHSDLQESESSPNFADNAVLGQTLTDQKNEEKVPGSTEQADRTQAKHSGKPSFGPFRTSRLPLPPHLRDSLKELDLNRSKAETSVHDAAAPDEPDRGIAPEAKRGPPEVTKCVYNLLAKEAEASSNARQRKAEGTKALPKEKASKTKAASGEASQTPDTPAAEEEGGSSTVFVKNLAWVVDSDVLYYFFEDCGKVTDVRIGQDDDGCSRGFGHIEFGTPAAAKKALEKNGHDLMGRDIFVEPAQDTSNKTLTPQSGASFRYRQRGPGQDRLRQELQQHSGHDHEHAPEGGASEAEVGCFHECAWSAKASMPRSVATVGQDSESKATSAATRSLNEVSNTGAAKTGSECVPSAPEVASMERKEIEPSRDLLQRIWPRYERKSQQAEVTSLPASGAQDHASLSSPSCCLSRESIPVRSNVKDLFRPRYEGASEAHEATIAASYGDAAPSSSVSPSPRSECMPKNFPSVGCGDKAAQGAPEGIPRKCQADVRNLMVAEDKFGDVMPLPTGLMAEARELKTRKVGDTKTETEAPKEHDALRERIIDLEKQIYNIEKGLAKENEDQDGVDSEGKLAPVYAERAKIEKYLLELNTKLDLEKLRLNKNPFSEAALKRIEQEAFAEERDCADRKAKVRYDDDTERASGAKAERQLAGGMARGSAFFEDDQAIEEGAIEPLRSANFAIWGTETIATYDKGDLKSSSRRVPPLLDDQLLLGVSDQVQKESSQGHASTEIKYTYHASPDLVAYRSDEEPAASDEKNPSSKPQTVSQLEWNRALGFADTDSDSDRLSGVATPSGLTGILDEEPGDSSFSETG